LFGAAGARDEKDKDLVENKLVAVIRGLDGLVRVLVSAPPLANTANNKRAF
jgi:hypothetical protein